MKKTLSILLAIIMTMSLFSVAACKKDTGTTDPTSQVTSTDAPTSTQTPTSTTTPTSTQTPTSTDNPTSTQTPTSTDNPTSTVTPTSDSTPTSSDVTPVEGYNVLNVYWDNTGDISACDVWMWWDGKEGSGHLFEKCEYGAKCTVQVPDTVDKVGFIVRKNCSAPGGSDWGNASKDFDGDREVMIDEPNVSIYLKQGVGNIYYSNDGGKTLFEKKQVTFSTMMDFNTVRVYVSPKAKFTDKSQFKITCDGVNQEISAVTGLGSEVAMSAVTLAQKIDIAKVYEVEVEGYGKAVIQPTKLFETEEFKNNYVYDGNDLGATVSGSTTTFKLWAPTASKVVLNLFDSGNEGQAKKTVELTKGAKGVWATTEACGHGTYYTYTVTTAAGTQEAVDPYARSTGLNGNRGMVVDLDRTDPTGFASEGYYTGLTSYSDASIWEVHVRDFSNKIGTSQYKGKYLAFTETGLKNASGVSVGIDYLKNLGITHVHLNPVYDFQTVEESQPDGQFNWGYDPKNYNVPEGSYSTDPHNGEVRIREFKQMVQALHAAGIGVIMDVVYNHTYDGNSSLNKIVPYYYYRYDITTGKNMNGSGCGNETASEHEMFRKYMIDSLTYWQSEYKIDGFRFDLMGLHDVDTMQAIEQALHAVNPQAIIYGEGWTGGTSGLLENKQMTTKNAKKVKASAGAIGGVAVFNDAVRDGLKGSVFDAGDKGYVNGNPSNAMAAKVEFGLVGGAHTVNGVAWSVENGNIINYVSCHDNYTLYDKLVKSCPTASDAEIAQMTKLCASVLFISKGAPFFLAGEEMLRTKKGDENSYKSSDEINNIDWEALKPGSLAMEVSEFYKTLITLRKQNEFLRNSDVSCRIVEGLIEVTYTKDGNTVGMALVNPYDTAKEWNQGGTLIFNGSAIVNENTTINNIPAKSVVVFKF